MDKLEANSGSVHSYVAAACRPHSACAGRSRSRSFRSGPIAAIDWSSRIPGPRAGENARSPSAPRSSGNSSTRQRHSPRARVSSRLATPPTATISKFSLSVRAGRHSRLPRPSPFLCAGALPGIDWLGVPRTRRHQVQATHAEAEGNRSRGAGSNQPRDGPRPRANYGGVFRSIGFHCNTRQ